MYSTWLLPPWHVPDLGDDVVVPWVDAATSVVGTYRNRFKSRNAQGVHVAFRNCVTRSYSSLLYTFEAKAFVRLARWNWIEIDDYVGSWDSTVNVRFGINCFKLLAN